MKRLKPANETKEERLARARRLIEARHPNANADAQAARVPIDEARARYLRTRRMPQRRPRVHDIEWVTTETARKAHRARWRL